MLRPTARAALALLACSALSCAGAPRRGGASARPPEDQLARAALLLANQHVDPLEFNALLRAAARALDAEAATATTGARPRTADGQAPPLGEAVARLRAARPDVADAEVVALGLRAMTEEPGVEARWLAPAELQRLTGAAIPAEERAYVGLSLRSGAPFPAVERVLPDAPAAVAGVEPGSELRAVDGVATAGRSLDEVTALLRGRAGTEARLALGRPGGETREVAVRRAEAEDPVDCRILDRDLLFLGVTSLGRRTAARVQELAIRVPARGVVLDLRGNGGGLLDAAHALADLFLEDGIVLTTEGRTPEWQARLEARPATSPLERVPLAVLVDERTGSGAAAVAAALQDARRAKLVGAPSKAPARVDVMYDFDGAGALRMPVSRIVRRGGAPLEHGLVPDAVVEQTELPETPLSDAACPRFASPAPVASQPAVRRAVELLSGR